MERFTKLANGKTCCTYFGWSEECKRVQGHCCECKTNDLAWDKLRRYEEVEEKKNEEKYPCLDCCEKYSCDKECLEIEIYREKLLKAKLE